MSVRIPLFKAIDDADLELVKGTLDWHRDRFTGVFLREAFRRAALTGFVDVASAVLDALNARCGGGGVTASATSRARHILSIPLRTLNAGPCCFGFLTRGFVCRLGWPSTCFSTGLAHKSDVAFRVAKRVSAALPLAEIRGALFQRFRSGALTTAEALPRVEWLIARLHAFPDHGIDVVRIAGWIEVLSVWGGARPEIVMHVIRRFPCRLACGVFRHVLQRPGFLGVAQQLVSTKTPHEVAKELFRMKLDYRAFGARPHAVHWALETFRRAARRGDPDTPGNWIDSNGADWWLRTSGFAPVYGSGGGAPAVGRVCDVWSVRAPRRVFLFAARDMSDASRRRHRAAFFRQST